MSLRLFMHYFRLRMKERMEYRGAFLLGLGSQMLGYAASYLVIWLALQRFQEIGGWNWPEIAFLYSLNVLTYALGAAFTYTPMLELEQMVQKGTFDPILIRPMNPYLTLAAQKFNVGYLGHILLSGSILVWSVGQVDVAWTPVRVIFLGLSIIGGMFIQAAALTLVGAWSFTQVRTDVVSWFYGTLREFQNYPVSIFGAVIQVLLTTVVPLAFANFYPAMILLGKDSGAVPFNIGWFSPLIGPLMFGLAYLMWRRGMNRYQGAGG
jgi:ABC-2 type transport system permease protein